MGEQVCGCFLGFKVWEVLGLRVEGLGFKVWEGLGLRVEGCLGFKD